jgi:hypothetical protein
MDLVDIKDVSIFSEHLGSQFQIAATGNRFVAAELKEAVPLKPIGHGSSASIEREPFSLVFQVDEQIDLPQRIYTVHHDELGELTLFLVPVGPGKLESIFN